MEIKRTQNTIPLANNWKDVDAILKNNNQSEALEAQRIADNNIAYFNQQENTEYQKNDDTTTYPDIFSMSEEKSNTYNKNTLLNLPAKSSLDTDKKFENMLNKHLQNANLTALWQLIPNGEKIKAELNELVDEIASCPEGMEMALVEKNLSRSVSKAQIYLALMFIFEELHARKIKRKFQEDLSTDIEKYALQESGFLFEFFSIQANSDLKALITAGGVENLAKLNTGEVAINDLKQAVAYIRDNFNGNFKHIVSIYIKLRAKQLKLLCDLNFERRNQLSELFKIEKYFILVHTVYLRIITLMDKLKNEAIPSESKLSDSIIEFLNFCDSVMINDAMVGNLVRGLGISRIELKSKIVLLKEISRLLSLSQIPAELFKGPKEQQRFIQAIRTNLSNYNQSRPHEKKSASFLKQRQFIKIGA